jgi:hypothetical protein
MSRNRDVGFPIKVWRRMGAGQDDGQLHSHKKDVVKSASFRCVLCCRICFDPYGSVYDRDAYYNPKLVEDVEQAECCKRDVVRVGNNASVKCTVCNVFLCDNKAGSLTVTRLVGRYGTQQRTSRKLRKRSVI